MPNETGLIDHGFSVLNAMKPLLAPKELPKDEQQGSGINSLSQYASRDVRKVEKQRVACVTCQKAKAKCDGLRPKCSRCARKRNTDCVYRERLHMRDQLDALKVENEALRKQVSQSSNSENSSATNLTPSNSATCREYTSTPTVGTPASSPDPSASERVRPQDAIPLHLSLPLHITPYEPEKDILRALSMSYTSFKTAALAMLAKGVSMREVLGPENISVDILVHGRLPQDTYHSVCTWACEIARSFERIDFLYRLAISFLLARFLRWVIVPTAENYALVPDIMKPTALQRQVPHFPCIDLVLLPPFRDSLLKRMRDFTSPAQMAGVDFNWPYELREAVCTDQSTGAVTVSPLFAEHISDIKNWKFGRALLDAFPEIETTVEWADNEAIAPLMPDLENLELGE